MFERIEEGAAAAERDDHIDVLVGEEALDVEADDAALAAGIADLLARGRQTPQNVYGDGRAGPRIATLLASVPLDAALLMKVNGY